MKYNIFQLAKNIIINVLEDDIPFSLAVKNSLFKNRVEREDGRDISALVGCELRHHIIFSHLIKEEFQDIPFSALCGISFYLANSLFLKRFDEKTIYKFAVDSLKEYDPNIDINKFDNLISKTTNSKELIPSNFKPDSLEYWSFRFNTPLWVVRMWSKQFGKGIAFKMLKSNYKPSLSTIKVNPLYAKEDDVLNFSSDFQKTIVPGILSYSGKLPLKKNRFFINNGIFYEKMATKVIIDSLDIEPLKRIAIYCAFPNNIYLDLVSRYGTNLEMDIVTSSTPNYFETKRAIESLGLSRVALFDQSHNEIVTSISNKVDVFFVLPANTMLDLLRTTPDYFVRVRQDSLDGILQAQKETLENADKRVEVDGKIVYMIPTLSMKEGHLNIVNFLKTHTNYSLVEEKQFFPFESLDSCLYYAILKKNND